MPILLESDSDGSVRFRRWFGLSLRDLFGDLMVQDGQSYEVPKIKLRRWRSYSGVGYVEEPE